MFLIVLIILSTSYSNAAPVGWMTTASSSSPHEQGTVARILNNATFNSTDNFYTIKKVFQPQPGTHKICIPIAFNITCTDMPKCDNIDTENNCTSGFYKSMLWTEFDTADIAGKLMLYFASSDLNVFGFDWAGACEVPVRESNDYDSEPSINLVVPSLLCNDTNLESEIHQSLLYITTLVRNYNTINIIVCVYQGSCMCYKLHCVINCIVL